MGSGLDFQVHGWFQYAVKFENGDLDHCFSSCNACTNCWVSGASLLQAWSLDKSLSILWAVVRDADLGPRPASTATGSAARHLQWVWEPQVYLGTNLLFLSLAGGDSTFRGGETYSLPHWQFGPGNSPIFVVFSTRFAKISRHILFDTHFFFQCLLPLMSRVLMCRGMVPKKKKKMLAKKVRRRRERVPRFWWCTKPWLIYFQDSQSI